jgi:hypothetical protein
MREDDKQQSKDDEIRAAQAEDLGRRNVVGVGSIPTP